MELNEVDTAQGAEQGFSVTLTDVKTGGELPVKITVLGQDSEAYRERHADLMRRRVDRFNRTRKVAADQAEQDAYTVEMLVAVTTGWTGLKRGGQDFPFTPENARALYSHPGWKWIRDQVEAAVQDRANFLPRSTTS